MQYTIDYKSIKEINFQDVSSMPKEHRTLISTEIKQQLEFIAICDSKHFKIKHIKFTIGVLLVKESRFSADCKSKIFFSQSLL